MQLSDQVLDHSHVEQQSMALEFQAARKEQLAQM
jgi:hypothetical protein